MKPIRRSALRLHAGKLFYTCRRYLQWLRDWDTFTTDQLTPHDKDLPYVHAEHRTPLLRQLRNVDMWLQHNKVDNLKLAVPRLNGMLIRGGKTLSYWRRIGKPTRRKGYKDGMVLYYGGFRHGVGGGLCQLSNLIYWMTLHTPLAVVERHRHSYDVFPDANRILPFGSGATCAYNYLDLQIRNDAEDGTVYQLKLWLTDSELVGEWRSNRPALHRYEVYERAHRIVSEPWGGYTRHNEIWRRCYNPDGELIEDSYVTENHALMMYAPLLRETGEDGSA